MPDQTFPLRQGTVPRTIPGTGISWTAPGLRGELSYEFKPAREGGGPQPPAGLRDTTRSARGDVIDQALGAIGVLDIYDLQTAAETPEVRRAEGTRAGTGELQDDEFLLEYEPKPDEYSFVLYEDEDGALSVHFPDNLAERVEKREEAKTTLRASQEPAQRYRIALRKPAGRPPAPGESTTRFGITVIGKKVLKLIVGKIAKKLLEPVVGKAEFGAVWIWESTMRRFEGFHGGANADALLTSTPVTLPATEWAGLQGAGKTSLLFLHGTTSTTSGAFGALKGNPGAESFLYKKYEGRVIGFNHHTLTKSVTENVADFYAQLPPNGNLHFDVICHSRGGLVARALKELSLGQISTLAGKSVNAPPNVSIERVVFVGTPNIGTQLADPNDIPHAMDLLANVASIFPGAGIALAGVLASVAYAAEAGFKALPGLQDMRPGNSFLGLLNQSGTAGSTPVTDYYAVQSSFSLDGILNQVLLAAVRYLFKGNLNDLIVPTLGVSDIDGTALAESRVYYFGKAPAKAAVAHTKYFEHSETWTEIRKALT